jgi:hypothetical protein
LIEWADCAGGLDGADDVHWEFTQICGGGCGWTGCDGVACDTPPMQHAAAASSIANEIELDSAIGASP